MRAGGIASPCASAMCCSRFPVFCWRSAWWRSWAAAWPNVIVAVAIFSIPAFARLVRGNTLVLKHLTYIESARSIGALGLDHHPAAHSAGHSVFDRGLFYPAHRHLDHHRRQPVVSGPGRPAADAGVGAMLNEARADMVIAPHVAIFPSLAIFITVLAFNLLGDGLRDALDPKLKG